MENLENGSKIPDRRSLKTSTSGPSSRVPRLPFWNWEAIFKDAMMTAAAINRLVHHSVIIELNIPSYRVEYAKEQQQEETQGEAIWNGVAAKKRELWKCRVCGKRGKPKAGFPLFPRAPWKSRLVLARFPHSHRPEPSL